MFDEVLPSAGTPIEWRMFRRREKSSTRDARPNQFYAVHVDSRNLSQLSVDELSSLIGRTKLIIDLPSEYSEQPSLSDLTMDELKAMARERGLSGYSRLKKAELIQLIEQEQKNSLVELLSSNNLFSGPRIHSIGDALPLDSPVESYTPPEGTTAIFPTKPDGTTEMLWGTRPEPARSMLKDGYMKVNMTSSKTTIKYLAEGTIEAIEEGNVMISGRDDQNAVIGHFAEQKMLNPKTVWNKESHNAQTSGSLVLKKLAPNADFQFPKSLYAVEDILSFFIKSNPDAVVLDYFGGSGTTTHAVMRLNQGDQGRRTSILVSNNEMSSKEEAALRKDGFNERDKEFQAQGIFYSVTMPRIKSAATGTTPEGEAIEGVYKHNLTRDYHLGMDENIRFYELDYLDPDYLTRNKSFSSISHILWMISGSRGSVIDQLAKTFTLQPEGGYGILFDMAHWQEFVDAVKEIETMTQVFIITDSKAQYQQVLKNLPTNINAIMLYEDYLTNFQIGVRRL